MRLFILLLAVASALTGQVAEQANENYRTAEGRARMAASLGDPGRAERLQADKIIASIDIKPGMTVADIGSGAGAMLPYFSKAVGLQGKVIAQDIYEDFLATAGKNASAKGLTNVTYVKGTARDTGLPDACCDVAVTIDAYHHFDFPELTLARLKKALKPNGRFVIVDYYKRAGAMGSGPRAEQHIRLDMDDVVKEVEANGFKLLSTKEHVPGSQWLGIFVRKD